MGDNLSFSGLMKSKGGKFLLRNWTMGRGARRGLVKLERKPRVTSDGALQAMLKDFGVIPMAGENF